MDFTRIPRKKTFEDQHREELVAMCQAEQFRLLTLRRTGSKKAS